MFSAIRKRFTYANVAMTLALVLAMTGGAYAAKHYLITSTKQISPKVLASLKGKAGTPGAPGPEGKQGPTGPAGKDGAVGPEGKQGPAGLAGKDGAPGSEGKEGSPWTAKGTLPSGATLTGEWSLNNPHVESGFHFVVTSASFDLPLAEAPVAHYIKFGETAPEGCTGTVAEPGAQKGNLCVFASQEINNTSLVLEGHPLPLICDLSTTESCVNHYGSGRFGFALETLPASEGAVSLSGTWAVTAE